MSRMMLRSNGKPPLARSPIRLRPRRKPLQPTATNTTHTPPGSLTKSQLPNRNWDVENSGLRPEYHTISCELRALAKMVQQELGNKDETTLDGGASAAQRSPLFERGRFYDEYSARRNERLKRKKGETEKKSGYDLGVRVESAMKVDGRRKAAVDRREARTPRYSLRSGARKENQKPPVMPIAISSVEKSVGVVTERKVGVRSIRKK
ncbi:uncharacterized protein LOC105178720 [Sesamum indicum]|uniref:Uncharacterized protein LOC105178720 n=1 Tax=Sesamum indicum TaxID=4182 RepID=A0A6I9UJJ4_SESIN|nr:uncharacterized protein LOC105178720 [Sesamum indicum]